MEELFELMAADVAEDAAKFGLLEKPRGPPGLAQAMRAEADDLNHATDRPSRHQVRGIHCGLHMQPLGIIDHVLPAGTCDGRLRGIELRQRCKGGLVGEVVLACFHDADTKRAAVAGDGGAGDQFDLRISQNFIEGAGDLCCRVFGAKGRDFFFIGVEDPLELGTGFQQAVALAVNVAMVEMDGGEYEFARLDHGTRSALRGVVHSVGLLRQGHG